MLNANGQEQAHEGLAGRTVVTPLNASLHGAENSLSAAPGLESSGRMAADFRRVLDE